VAHCSIALGGNQGDPETSFQTALQALEAAGHPIISVSRVYRTPAMGKVAGGDFLNATAILETSLSPNEMLAELHRLEKTLGRNRTQHWGPRTIDLDLLLYDQAVLDNGRIIVPHPAMWYRRFVLEPLSEIAEGWIHPVLGETVGRLLERLNALPMRLHVLKISESQLMAVVGQLATEFDDTQFELLQNNDNLGDIFAQINIADSPASPSRRTQPPHESGRIIRRPIRATSITADDELTSFLRDILTAALAGAT